MPFAGAALRAGCPTLDSSIPCPLSEIARDLVVEARVAPAAVVAIAERTTRRFSVRVGSAGALGGGFAGSVASTTLFDLASVTKPLIAATCMRLERRGLLRLDGPLAAILPEARETPSEAMKLELLLAHRAGLEPHRNLFAPLRERRPFDRRAALIEAARARRPSAPLSSDSAGFEAVYSDLGYLLMGEAVSRAVGRPLDVLVHEEVVAPLGLEIGSMRQLFAADRNVLRRVAPTEVVPWRGGELRGVVHDENSWAIAGHGVAGPAGLFGTAESIARFGAAMLDALAGRARGFLDVDEARRLTRSRPGGTLAMGFDGKSTEGSSAGTRAGPSTFGHLGFTGTSLWCDPDADIVTVLLTNRVHPSRDNVAIRSARPHVHDALFALASGG